MLLLLLLLLPHRHRHRCHYYQLSVSLFLSQALYRQITEKFIEFVYVNDVMCNTGLYKYVRRIYRFWILARDKSTDFLMHETATTMESTLHT